MRANLIAACLALSLAVPARAQPSPPPIAIVAAENFYGDVAGQIGGADVRVTSILSNPDQDPHLFEASPSVARALSAARIVVYSGIGLRPLDGKTARRRAVARSPDHRRRRPGRPQVRRQSAYLVRPRDHARLRQGRGHSAGPPPIRAQMPSMTSASRSSRRRLRRSGDGSPPCASAWPARRSRRPSRCSATCSRPWGCRCATCRSRLAVMNDTEPSASDIAAFETDLRTHAVKLLVYNAQASDPIAQRMERLARQAARPGRRRGGDRAAGQNLSGMDAEGAGRRGSALPRACHRDVARMPARIALRRCRAGLGGRTILRGVSDLGIRAAEFIGVLGPNGAGKTTLMRAILGPRAAAPPERSACWAQPAARGNPAIGYMPQVRGDTGRQAAQRLGFRRQRGATAIASGLPLLDAAGRARGRLGAGPGRRARPGEPAAGGDLRRRAAAAAAGPDADRAAQAAAAGRAADQPRPRAPAGGGGAGEVVADGTGDRRAVQRARAEPAAGRARPRAVSRRRPGGAGHGGRGDHRHRCCRACTARRSRWCG